MRDVYELRKSQLQMRQTELEVTQRAIFFAGSRDTAIDAELAANSAEIAELTRRLQER